MKRKLALWLLSVLLTPVLPAYAQHSVKLSCTPGGDATTFNFYRGTVTGGPYTKQTATAQSSCAFTDSNVVYGSNYFYVATGLDANGESGFSNEVKVSIPQAVSTLALSASQTSIVSGTSDTFTATITTPGPSPTGTITFKDGTTNIATVNVTGGVGTFGTSTLSVGTHTITAVYSGDSPNAGSTSTSVSVVVSTPPPPPAPTGLTGTVL